MFLYKNLVKKKKSTFIYLLGTLISRQSHSNAVTTVAGTLTVTTSVINVCSLNVPSMNFSLYSENLISSTANVTTMCTNGLIALIYFDTVPDGGDKNYKLIAESRDGSQLSNYLLVNFKKENSNGEYMSNNTGIITTTGTGSQVTAGTIYGEVPGGQSGKVSGTYSKVLSLQIVYGN